MDGAGVASMRVKQGKKTRPSILQTTSTREIKDNPSSENAGNSMEGKIAPFFLLNWNIPSKFLFYRQMISKKEISGVFFKLSPKKFCAQ
jgi:hypothetical protein